ncbi:hypothetical protein [Lacticaseibacillus nasuensis]|uniref:hypothetical protein n=1 Tax=Lacticaseibacillus nasuensis TaxID=944671 RepID=UPI002248221C|nr:hypothetical protein [Lacticaseibacillus nasuensis]MCX2455224.1 hypothetical protein [Lacticaseibacillus nasuensis]
MTSRKMSTGLRTLFLVQGILGCLTALPIFYLGWPMSLAALGIGIAQLIQLPAGQRWRTAPVLMVVATSLEILFWLGLIVTVGSVTGWQTTADGSLSNAQTLRLVTGIGAWALVAIASWVTRIVATVFAFIAYARANRELRANEN